MTPARERNVVLVLAAISALRVFVFSAAFPFFGVNDEPQHFDVVVRYANADPPRAVGAPCAEAIPYLVTFSTPEYLVSPNERPDGRMEPPLWKQRPEAVRGELAAGEMYWRNEVKGIEASQPPLYYALAGAWWRIGKVFGWHGLAALYALRFVNIAVVVATVLLAWLAARTIVPDNAFVRIAAPALIAFMPQTIFYAVNNDVLSPLTFGASYVLLLRFLTPEPQSLSRAAATGGALAATFLTKMANAPLLLVAGVFTAFKLRELSRRGGPRASMAQMTVLAVCAGIPMVAWMAWCRTHFGDLTGSAQKIRHLGWTVKPFSQWLDHPIFTPEGAWTFIGENLATLWQGDTPWYSEPLSMPAADRLYGVGTLVLLGLALASLSRRRPPRDGLQRTALWFGLACVGATFAFLALLSVMFDFDGCFSPSRERPFFTSGRLMLGMLVPFVILVAVGLDRAVDRLGESGKRVALALLLATMLATEIAIDWRIFPSDYNWFHI